jgi:two-component system chemotaxis response regulator CheY
MKIMVVDDSSVMRKIVIRTIGETKFAGGPIVEAGDGAEALKKFDSEKPDWVFCDWNMPNMNGIDFVKQARQLKTKKHVPIVMVTTEGTMGKMEEALNEGVDSYIVKPFTGEQLERVMSKVAEKNGITE